MASSSQQTTTTNGAPIRVEIFRAGTHTPTHGAPVTMTVADLSKIAASYSEDKHDAPVVIGHPNHDKPAYGWTKALVVENDKLIAELKDIEPSFAEAVRSKRYAKISAAFFAPNSSNNPMKGAWYLKHIGFLGAATPAVPGLKKVQFSENDDDTVSFGGWSVSESEAYYQRLIQNQKNSEFIENMVQEGKILPCHKDGVVSFLEHISASGSFSFSENGSGNEVAIDAADFFKKFIKEIPKIVTFGEIAGRDGGKNYSSTFKGLTVPDGYEVAQDTDALHSRAIEISNKKSISFAAALDEVMGK